MSPVPEEIEPLPAVATPAVETRLVRCPRRSASSRKGVLVAPVVSARDQDLAEVIASVSGAFDFLIVEGMVLKETSLGGRRALEVLGPGDVLAPPLTAVRQIESRAISRYLAHGRVTLAALEGRFRRASQTLARAGRCSA